MIDSENTLASRKLLHVLGGGPWQVPTVKLAQAMGYRVLVTDMHSLRLIDLAMGQRPLIAPRAHKRCANIEFLRVPAGRFGGVLNVAQAAAVADVAAIVFNVSPGDAVGALDDKDQRPGYILALSDTSVASFAACERARGLKRVCMQGVSQPMVLS